MIDASKGILPSTKCRPRFAFTCGGVQYTGNRHSQEWTHSPAICHGLIQTALEQGEAGKNLQYSDVIIMEDVARERAFPALQVDSVPVPSLYPTAKTGNDSQQMLEVTKKILEDLEETEKRQKFKLQDSQLLDMFYLLGITVVMCVLLLWIIVCCIGMSWLREKYMIAESLELEDTYKGSSSPTPGPAQDTPKIMPMCLRALSKCFLNSASLVLPGKLPFAVQ
ncbi:hypothetical protein HGM15179_007249 [Zosterops borbonicus]|uniref:Uncharacterized protein n=1 Tax=Zosterops borbonicus TaxID=364589 RepID=A0A8K1GKG8_9PASS|nr:hypothetical protein HGM15179_007249 [Zosterops borbonicus]